MRSKSIKSNLTGLIKDGHKWQYTDINGKGEKPTFYFSNVQFILIALSMVCFLFLDGFSKDFIGYIITSLSLFVGLFLTLIITVFDKFQNIKFVKPNISEQEEVKLKQTKNFFQQFTALTSYSILLSIVTIFLLSLSLLTDFFNVDVFAFHLISNVDQIVTETIINFLIVFSISLYRIIIVYLFLDFLLIVVYAVVSIYTHISTEYKSIKVTDSSV